MLWHVNLNDLCAIGIQETAYTVLISLTLCASFFRMILSVKGEEAAKSEDMFAQIEEMLISVRLAFLNCFLICWYRNSFSLMYAGKCTHCTVIKLVCYFVSFMYQLTWSKLVLIFPHERIGKTDILMIKRE